MISVAILKPFAVLTGAAYFFDKAFGSFERKNDIFTGSLIRGRTFVLLYRVGQVNLAHDDRRLALTGLYRDSGDTGASRLW